MDLERLDLLEIEGGYSINTLTALVSRIVLWVSTQCTFGVLDITCYRGDSGCWGEGNCGDRSAPSSA